MKKSTLFWLAVVGILMVVLGVICICKSSSLFAASWVMGGLTLIIGIAKMVFTFETQKFLPNSASRMLSSLLMIILGLIFLFQKNFMASSLPVIFAMWLLIEGVIIAVQSFDYKDKEHNRWWIILILGIVAAILGIIGLQNPDISTNTLSIFIGLGAIILGLAYLIALLGLYKAQKQIGKLGRAIGIGRKKKKAKDEKKEIEGEKGEKE